VGRGPNEIGMGIADVELRQYAAPKIPEDRPTGQHVVDVVSHCCMVSARNTRS
jgi:hypothetical protein